MCEVMARRLYEMSDTMPFAGLSASDFARRIVPLGE
jgi:hypothetical protein